MTGNNLSATLKITTITPLHIGDGEELILDLDYKCTNRALEIYHPDDILKFLGEAPGALADISRGNTDLFKLASDYKLALTPLYALDCTTPPPTNIRKFIKNAHCLPYLPGSSLKGAVRTALWTGLDRSSVPHPARNYGVFKEQVNKIGGQDPHHDFLRPLRISDSHPVSPAATLEVREIKYFNLTNEDRPGWKDFGSRARPTRRTFQEASGVFVEALKSNVNLIANISLDRFFSNHSIKESARMPGFKGTENLTHLAQAVNQHTLAIAQSELEFFSQFGNVTADVSQFYKSLIQRTQKIMKEPSSFIIRLAWGSGWRGMTGNWLRGEELEIVRKQEHLGKCFCPKCGSSNVSLDRKSRKKLYRCKKCRQVCLKQEVLLHPQFPKTRRLAMKDGSPSLPLGWVLVEITQAGEFSNYSIRPTEARSERLQQPLTPPAAPVDPEEIKKDRLESFETRLDRVQNLPGEINGLINSIKANDDTQLKKELCQVLLNKAKSLKKKSKFEKALGLGKKWALELKELCEELGVS